MTEEQKGIQFKQVGFHVILQEWIVQESLENFEIAVNGQGPHPWLDMLYDQAMIFAEYADAEKPGGKESAQFEEERRRLARQLGPYPDGDMSYTDRRQWRKLIYSYYTRTGLIKPGERDIQDWHKDHFDSIEEELRK